jgi:hypothetical protein
MTTPSTAQPSQKDLLRSFLGGNAAALEQVPAALRDAASRARDFATQGGTAPDLGGDVGQALVDHLAAAGAAERLAALGASPNKDTAKAVRRALHALKSRGVDVPEAARAPSGGGGAGATTAGPAASVLTHAPEEEPSSYASILDGAGERMVWLVRKGQNNKLEVFEARLNDRLGVMEFRRGETTRKRLRNLAERLTTENGFTVAPIAAEFARSLIEEAYEVSRTQERGLPGGFIEARPRLGKAPAPLATHPALAAAGAAEAVSGGTDTLHKMAEFQSWYPDPEMLRVAAGRVEEVDQSQLVTDEKQRHEARLAAMERTCNETFTPDVRKRYQRRLHEMAYLFQQLGRAKDAQLSLAAAREQDDTTNPAWTSPFVRSLFERCLIKEGEESKAPPEAERAAGGRLIIPA